jgi:RimJ/RimL family protein N-acetyltransferase
MPQAGGIVSVSLRKVTADDAPLLVQWRNADIEFFGDGKTLLTREGHDRWYSTVYLNDPRDHMYVVMCDDFPAGTIAAILGEKGTEISRVLLGEKKLVHTGVMSEALKLLTDIYPGPHWLRVKPYNAPAINFYLKNRFVLSGTDHDPLLMSRS